MAANSSANSLFGTVCFYILKEHLEAEDKEEKVRELKRILTRGGGIEESFISGLVTHIIADVSVDDIQSIKGDDCKAIVIHSKWVHLSDQCHCLLPVTPFESQEYKIFSGVVACPSGVSSSDKDKLHALILYYGGAFQRTLDENVSHLITISPQGRKYTAATEHNILTVRPEWVLECIRQNNRVPESEFLVEGADISPKVSKNTTVVVETMEVSEASSMLIDKEKMLVEEMFDNGNMEKEDSTNGEKEEKEVKERLQREVVERRSEGEEEGLPYGVSDISVGEEQAMEIPQTQEGEETVPSANVMYPTLERIPKVKSSESPTSTSSVQSDKNTVACTPQPSDISGQHSSNNPTNDSGVGDEGLLQEIVFLILDYSELLDTDTLQKWNSVIKKHGGHTVGISESEKCTHLLSQNTSSEVYHQVHRETMCVASAHWLNDILSKRRMFPPSNPLHFPVAYEDTPTSCQELSICITNYTGSEREVVRDMIRMSGLSYTGQLSQSTTHLVCKRPDGRKYEKALEWGVAVVNSVFISDIMHSGVVPGHPTIERYSKLGAEDEFRAAPCSQIIQLMKPWQQFMFKYSVSNPKLTDHDLCQQCFSCIPPAKSINHVTLDSKPKESNSAAAKVTEAGPVVLFTGFNIASLKHLKSICKSGGIEVTTDPSKCTHLVAPRVARTIKFLCAISVCQYVLSSQWLEECKTQGKLVGSFLLSSPDETQYVLQDREAEEAFNMNLSVSMSRASERKLLKDLAIHVTRNVVPDHDSLKQIIECGGGKFYTPSDLQTIYGRKFERLGADGLLLVVISCPEDVLAGLCSEFYSRKIPVYSAEFILSGILRQSLSYDENQLIIE